MREVSVVTVNFNQPEVTEQLIQSIFRHCSIVPEIIVVDNCSTVNPVPGWIVKFPGIRFIRSDINLGFAGGNNLGIREASGELIFLANNDTEFTPGLLEELNASFTRHPAAGAVCPKILFFHQPDTIQYVGYTPMNYYTIQNATIGLMEKDTGQYDHIERQTAFIHGAAVLLKRSAIHKAGPMPENYFLYYEEMDWSERIRANGFELWVNTDALIYHKESVSVGQKSALKEFFMNRNRILFARRNSLLPARVFFFIYFIFLVSPRNMILYLRERRSSHIFVLLRAIWWNLTHSTTSADLGFHIRR